MQKFWKFLQYNNAVPIGLFLLFSASGVALAATPAVQQAVYSTTDEVQKVDNTYIVSVDLKSRDFGLHVTGVTEDADNYYVEYAYKSINIIDYVWKDVDVAKTMTVSKLEIQGHDLGMFIAKQLGEDLSAQLAYLTEVQEKERKAGATAKVVSTAYSGLVGQMLDPTQKEFPGYVPVVAEQGPISPDLAAAIAGSDSSNPADPSYRAGLPPGPNTAQIQQLVDDAVARALAQNNAQPTAGAATPDVAAASTTDTTSPVVVSGGDTGTAPPPVVTPPATTTPPDTGTGSTTPPADTQPATTTPPDTTPATTTPPVSIPAPDPAPAPADVTPPAPDPTPAPPADTGTTTAP